MNSIEKVRKQNEVVYKILKQSFETNKLSHAYLFSGPANQEIINEPTMLMELLINESPFTEIKKRPEAYSDLIVLDGSDGLIKKDSVIEASSKLQEKALDELGVKILFIKNVENTNVQSINSLLKFIEEPTEKTFIIMTTNNISNVLPTIRSRAQVVNIRKASKTILVAQLQENGISADASQILAAVSDSYSSAIELSEKAIFKEGVQKLVKILAKAIKTKSEIIIGMKALLQKSNYKDLLSIFKVFLDDIWKEKGGIETTIKGISELLKSYENFDYKTASLILNDFIVSQNSNVNFELYKSKLLIELEECYE